MNGPGPDPVPAPLPARKKRRFERRAALVLVVIAVVWLGLALRLEGFINRVEPVPLPTLTPHARALHNTLFVADLHADSLLFGRNLLRRSRLGHVDLPRLREGGVALQVFSLPTRVPMGLNLERNDRGRADLLSLAGLAQLSPNAWRGPMARAQNAAARLHAAARASDEQLLVIGSGLDLERLQAARAGGHKTTGALLALEGAHALESQPENLVTLFEAGYRMIGLTHFFDNDYAGSAHGVDRGGLTPLGRETLREMERLGITLDLAHLSPAAVDEALDLSTHPAVFSHGGVRGTCDNQRNLSDEQVRRIAAGGGVVGIGYWDWAVCGTRPADIARGIVHVVELVGAAHAALGSDFDGGTTVGFDTSQLASLTQALIDAGLSDREIGQVLGDNVLRVLTANLPLSATPPD